MNKCNIKQNQVEQNRGRKHRRSESERLPFFLSFFLCSSSKCATHLHNQPLQSSVDLRLQRWDSVPLGHQYQSQTTLKVLADLKVRRGNEEGVRSPTITLASTMVGRGRGQMSQDLYRQRWGEIFTYCCVIWHTLGLPVTLFIIINIYIYTFVDGLACWSRCRLTPLHIEGCLRGLFLWIWLALRTDWTWVLGRSLRWVSWESIQN